MQSPPLLPEETLARVLRLAKFDGIGTLVLGSLFAVVTAAARDVPFAAVGLLAAGAGAVELHGVHLLREGEFRGMNWLLASQPFLLLVIWSYCALRWVHFEIPPLTDHLRELATATAVQLEMSVEAYFQLLNTITMAVLAGIALCYQGGMMIYYWRRRRPVAQALAEDR
ncbi:MAG: hypothetical protein FJ399_15030 [Verrucomicrobia bacterium]|nr:hypothetical protein [Verrucomicrobiota bacterium]